MSKFKNISQNDIYRCLLTEIIPYETPLRFTLVNLHRALNKGQLSKELHTILLGETNKDHNSEPYIFDVYVNENKTRKLGIFHPHSFTKVKALYSEYDLDILSMCRKSDWSLRAPYSIARTYRPQAVFFEEKSVNIGTNENVEDQQVIQANFSSYFTYNPFTHIGKYYESHDYLTCESRFRYCSKLDVASCFGNIYTHTVTWAVRTRSQAKREIPSRKSFAASFDRLMQSINSNETHGILVGSELSRIFAEIILQQVDIDTLDACANKNLKAGVDYEVRRYVDDYFLFFNNLNTEKFVVKKLRECLANYKLELNDAKQVRIERPFETQISIAKGNITESLRVIFGRVKNRRINDNILLEIRRILGQTGTSYSDCGSLIMARLYSEVQTLIFLMKNDLTAEEMHNCCCTLYDALKTSFFVVTVEPKYRSIVILTKMIARIGYFQHRNNISGGEGSIDCIGIEFRKLCVSFQGTGKLPLEIVCLFSSLAESPHFHPIPIKIIDDLILGSQPHTAYSFFEKVAILQALAHRDIYSDLVKTLVESIVSEVDSCSNETLLQDTEKFFLSIEIISNPLFPFKYRRALLKRLAKASKLGNLINVKADAILEELASLMPFYDRSAGFSVEQQVAKKELSFTY